MHDALYYARIYVGEGGTTASESAILGTPAVYINNLSMGYINDEKEAGLLFQVIDNVSIYKAIDFATKTKSKEYFRSLSKTLINEKIDSTAFLVWFIENYPKSVETMKLNPDYQYRFR